MVVIKFLCCFNESPTMVGVWNETGARSDIFCKLGTAILIAILCLDSMAEPKIITRFT